MSLELAEQSIQLLTCHISRWRLCHRSPQDNQSKSWKKVWPLFFLSLITSHAISTNRAEHTTSYRGRATTSFTSYHHQLKTWSLLSKDNQSKSWEKVWENWHCLSLVTSHVIQADEDFVIVHHKTTNPSLEKKCDLCFFVIDHFSRRKHQQSLAYNFL
jgi:hypothetical protein